MKKAPMAKRQRRQKRDIEGEALLEVLTDPGVRLSQQSSRAVGGGLREDGRSKRGIAALEREKTRLRKDPTIRWLAARLKAFFEYRTTSLMRDPGASARRKR